MEKFKEKRSTVIIGNISMVVAILGFLLLFSGIFTEIFILLGFALFLIGIGLIGVLIASLRSTRDTYTRKFIIYMQEKLKSARTLEELQEIETEFFDLAVKNNQYCLSFPYNLREINSEIINKIDILEKIQQ